MLGSHNVPIDPATGIPKQLVEAERKRVLAEKVTKVETLAHLLSQDLQSEQGRALLATVFEQLVDRLGQLMADDVKCQTLLSILDALNVKLNIVPKMVRHEMDARLAKVM